MAHPQIDPKTILTAEDRLIVALDVPSAAEAREAVEELKGVVSCFKVGLQLFTAAGPGFVEELTEAGHRIFLDLKFHDIPNTAAKAGVAAARLGVWMFNVHASGGGEMMRTVAAEVSEACVAGNWTRPLVIGVTVLTSSDVSTMSETGVAGEVGDQVRRLAMLTADCGLDGVVASAGEVGLIRSAVSNAQFCTVTPGIRPQNATKDDQKRVTAPGTAVLAGADYLVVGRPIVAAADRAAAAANILEEIRAALPKA